MTTEQEFVFWDIIDTFETEELLPYVMLIGSWAELLYQYYFSSDYKPSLRTTDVDFLYWNLHRPKKNINLSEALREKGFIYSESRMTGIGKFSKEGILDVEFLVRAMGKGDPQHIKIPSLGIVAIGLREVNMLAAYPLVFSIKDYEIIVPEPEIYILHKLLINPLRKTDDKKEKDLQSVRELLPYINGERLKYIFERLTKKQQIVIKGVCKANYIQIFPE
jgi:hypothetical protein